MTNLTAHEHVAWCKHRALLELDAPDQSTEKAIANAFASMVSDLRKHPDTEDHPANTLGMQLFIGGHLSTKAEMRRWIEGYN